MAGSKPIRRTSFDSFYPAARYLEKGFAPEKVSGGIPQLAALADAIRKSRDAGSIPISDRDQQLLLANALVENRPDFGVNWVAMTNSRRHNRRDFNEEKLLKALAPLVSTEETRSGVNGQPPVIGLESLPAPADGSAPSGQPGMRMTIQPAVPPRNRDSRGISDEFKPMHGRMWEQNAAAYLLRAALKQAERKQPTIGDALLNGWNGQGKVVMSNGVVVADADNHARKIQQTAAMLDDPANAPISQMFKQMVKGGYGGYEPFFDARDYSAQQGMGGQR
jgi:hypothetical protein